MFKSKKYSPGFKAISLNIAKRYPNKVILKKNMYITLSKKKTLNIYIYMENKIFKKLKENQLLDMALCMYMGNRFSESFIGRANHAETKFSKKYMHDLLCNAFTFHTNKLTSQQSTWHR
jgi:hypothetical protein